MRPAAQLHAIDAALEVLRQVLLGAVYGILLAYALYFPNRPIYLYFVFPIPAKYFVMIIGAISLLSAMNEPGGGIAHTRAELERIVLHGIEASPVNQVLVERFLGGWQEHELEVMSDSAGNCVIVC